jgi:type I restriction enzyme S subunit
VTERWANVSLGTLITDIEAGNSFKCDERPPVGDEIGVAKVSAVTWGRYQERESKTCTDPARVDPRLFVRAGDFIISRANTIELVGACVVAEQVTKRIMLSDKLLRLKFQGADERWILHFLRSGDGRQQIEALSTGNQLSMRNISQGALRAIDVPLPPLNEQRRIVAKLEDLLARSRRAKYALDAIPALLEKLRQSILAAAFRGDLTADWRAKNPDVEPASKLLERIRSERRKKWEEAELAKLKAKGKTPTDDRWKAKYQEPEPVDASGLPELPEGWCWASLEEICPAEAPIVYGIILPGDDYEGGVPYIRPVDIEDDGTVALSSLKRTSPEIANQYSRAQLQQGDLVLSIVGTIGKVFVVPPTLHGANITQSSVRIRPNKELATMYIRDILVSPILTRQYDKYRFGNAVQRLNVEHARMLAIPLAPHHEQREICLRISAALHGVAFDRIGALQKRCSALDASLLAKAFRGELVPQDPNDEPASVMLERLAAERAASEAQPAKSAPAKRTKPKR